MIVTIGTDDTLASPGAQLDYYQAVIDRMGRAGVDQFARFFVLPQTNHGLRGMSAATAGDGRANHTGADSLDVRSAEAAAGLGSSARRAPRMFVTVTAGDRSLPMCSYPAFPNYVSGPPTDAASYACVAK
jgi:feruloyl esterase